MTDLSPFCTRHPEGTDSPCGGCAEARRRHLARRAAQGRQVVAGSRARTAAYIAEIYMRRAMYGPDSRRAGVDLCRRALGLAPKYQ